MDLEHLHPANNMVRLRLSTNLPAVKGLTQSASPLNDCLLQRLKIQTNFEDVKSTEVTGYKVGDHQNQ